MWSELKLADLEPFRFMRQGRCTLRGSLLNLVAWANYPSLFCIAAMAQSTEIATITVHVTSQPSLTQGEKTPRVEMLEGKPSVQIGKAESGSTVGVALGTYIFLCFEPSSGALGFEVQPPGILVAPPGTYHLPNGLIGLVRAEKSGMATITVKAITGRWKYEH